MSSRELWSHAHESAMDIDMAYLIRDRDGGLRLRVSTADDANDRDVPLSPAAARTLRDALAETLTAS